VAEGDPAALDSLEAMLAEGPGAAAVDEVEASRGPAAGGMSRFEIRR
jgi:acylphosphatase